MNPDMQNPSMPPELADKLKKLEDALAEERACRAELEAQLELLKEKNTGLEKKLGDEKRLFDSVLDGIPMLVFVKDDQNNIVYVNKPAADSRGKRKDELEGKSTYDLYPDDAAHYYEDDLEVIKSGLPKTGIVEQIVTANEEKRWVRTSKFPWYDESGKIRGVLVTATDITEIVRQQDQREGLMASVAKALELSEERYYLAVRGSNDGIWDWNLKTNEVFYSPRYKELLGYRDDEFPNVFESFKSHVHPADLPVVLEKVDAHLKEQIPYEAEFRMKHKDGRWSWFSARGQAIWDKDGKPYRMAGSQRDITDRKQAEQNVNEFFSTVSHELRTPLSAVKGSLRLIESGLAGQISSEAKELLDIALSSCERLIRLVNDILDLRKIEAGKIDLHMSEVNASELIDEVFHGLASYADSHHVKISKSCPGDLYFEADHDRIVQVLTNLLGNAIKFSGQNAEVDLKVERLDSAFLRFNVQDSGPGIPAEQQHLLFMKFKQLDASDTRRQEGTGLGLAICKAIVLQHHGNIGVESTAGKGARFWFELPLGKVRNSAYDTGA